jgi:hypothetical protein
MASSYSDFIITTHELYSKYYDDWQLAVKSFYGGVEYREGQYLKQYQSDNTTPAETINTYDIDEYGNQTAVYKSQVRQAVDSTDANNGGGYASNFYMEKLQNVPVFPYTRLYTSEYNAILFRSPPTRVLPDTPEVEAFVKNTDGDGNSINEFMSMVDTYSTVFGVVWVSCLKPMNATYARWKMHKPTDVTNWSYAYDENGDLQLNRIVIRIGQDTGMEIFQYITPEEIQIIFRPTDLDTELSLPANAEFVPGEEDDDNDIGFYRIIQPNELGYIPVSPIYQSTPIYRGIGHTPIFDIAQIQRSVYSDMGEIYSAVSYGSHPVTLCDEDTLNRNDNSIGAEPGSTVVTGASLNGQPNYVFEFVAPPLDSISEIRSLIDQKIGKMNEVAMIRTEEIIKASRSGAQIEQYDSKLEAFIRKKATSMENAEYNLWKMWFDWAEVEMPEDLSISYNRLYSQKGLEHEIKEMSTLLDVYERFNSVFVKAEDEYVTEFATQSEAEAEAQRMGGTGTHSHTKEDGTTIYMPFVTHEEYELRRAMATEGDSNMQDELKQKLKMRLEQLIESTYSNNSL